MDVARKKGKRGRKIGKGKHKLERSRWHSYKALIEHQCKRRAATLKARFCMGCDTQFHSMGALKRHVCE
jgi:hypothetical protein